MMRHSMNALHHVYLHSLSMVLADPYLLLLQADGTLSGCSISQKNLVNLWTVPGRLLEQQLQHTCF